jgi:hypothetical protein
MGSPALERLETLLAARQLDMTLARAWAQAPVGVSTGIPALDEALGDGWRPGEVSEIVGPRSSGRTALLWATLTAATRRDQVVALVDTFDRFDPASAAAAGLVLERLLWVRGPALTLERAQAALVDLAVQRAIRALDLVVRAGGFAVAALDLCDVPARQLRALPPATWLRLAHANEGQPTVCLLAGDLPAGRSARGATVHLSSQREWTGTSLQSHRLGEARVRARIARMTLSGRDAEWTVNSA